MKNKLIGSFYKISKCLVSFCSWFQNLLRLFGGVQLLEMQQWLEDFKEKDRSGNSTVIDSLNSKAITFKKGLNMNLRVETAEYNCKNLKS